MVYRCDRCHKKFEGDETKSFTSGFYYVDSGYWAKYARPKADTTYETILCDQCMWEDPRYIDDYGIQGGEQHFDDGGESG